MLMEYFVHDATAQTFAVLIIGVISIALIVSRRMERHERAVERTGVLNLQTERLKSERQQLEYADARKNAKNVKGD